MESIKEIYKIGKGPSSSHTMGPKKAAEMFKGMTDVALIEALKDERSPRVDIIWKPDVFLPQHPNGMNFQAFDSEGHQMGEKTLFSIGGGDISEDGRRQPEKSIYPYSKMKDILGWCNKYNSYFWEYVAQHEACPAV